MPWFLLWHTESCWRCPLKEKEAACQLKLINSTDSQKNDPTTSLITSRLHTVWYSVEKKMRRRCISIVNKERTWPNVGVTLVRSTYTVCVWALGSCPTEDPFAKTHCIVLLHQIHWYSLKNILKYIIIPLYEIFLYIIALLKLYSSATWWYNDHKMMTKCYRLNSLQWRNQKS